MSVVYLFLYFAVVDNAITLFNCFFRDFRVFDLVVYYYLLSYFTQGFHDFYSTYCSYWLI